MILPHSQRCFRHLRHALVNPRIQKPQLSSFYSNLTRNTSSSGGLFQLPDFGDYSVILPPEPFVFGVSHIKPRHVPSHIARPPYVKYGEVNVGTVGLEDPIHQKTKNQCAADRRKGKVALGTELEVRLREAGRLAKQVREYARSLVQVGVTTNKIDEAVHEYIIARGAYPSPLLYLGFPRSCCTSVNNIIAHGIPDDRPLENGDIVNIDITIYLNGYHGDTSETFLVGDVDEKGRSLVEMSLSALHAGIAACGPGRPLKSIGQAIHRAVHRRPLINSNHRHIEEESFYSISPQFTGHGIGTEFHKPPWIIHDINEEPGSMSPGDCFTIEPCIVQGSDPKGWIFPDGWTTSTENCARSAQAEHMILITETGAEVLTD